MIKAAIFDVDGVIVNTDHLVSQTYAEIIKQYGKTPVYNEHGLIHKSGTRERDIFTILKEEYGIDDSIEILSEKKSAIYEELLKDIQPMVGVVKLLDLLKSHNIPLAVGTSGILRRTHLKLNTVKILHYFSVIVSGEDVKQGKPAPDIFLLAASRLHVDPQDCVVFEDAESGIIAAKKAGMKVVAVPTEFTKNHNFSGADFVVRSLDDITWEMVENL